MMNWAGIRLSKSVALFLLLTNASHAAIDIGCFYGTSPLPVGASPTLYQQLAIYPPDSFVAESAAQVNTETFLTLVVSNTANHASVPFLGHTFPFVFFNPPATGTWFLSARATVEGFDTTPPWFWLWADSCVQTGFVTAIP